MGSVHEIILQRSYINTYPEILTMNFMGLTAMENRGTQTQCPQPWVPWNRMAIEDDPLYNMNAFRSVLARTSDKTRRVILGDSSPHPCSEPPRIELSVQPPFADLSAAAVIKCARQPSTKQLFNGFTNCNKWAH